MGLESIPIPSQVDRRPISAEVEARLVTACRRIEAFQDRWDRPQIEQFVAADYRYVDQTLGWILETQWLPGRRFLEWGCGFAVVSALAAERGLDSVGIEAEAELVRQGRITLDQWGSTAELIEGNFLPRGAPRLADDPDLPSLGHQVPCGYTQIGLDLDDFAIVYGYPWPGEESFHQAVFEKYGGSGSLLLQFCGPYDLRLWRRRALPG